MDKCEIYEKGKAPHHARFNPCFNGFMDKCANWREAVLNWLLVSTLVLMDSWINAVKSILTK